MRNQLIGLQADLEAAEISYYSALDERDAAQKAMEDQQAKIDDANSQISDLQDKLGTRARNMYRNGSTSFVDSSWVPPRSKSSPRIGIFSTR